MLDSMRRNANSWVFSVLFAIIIFVFAVNFGPWAGRQTSSETYAAIVNGHVIGINQFNTELNRFAKQGISIEQMRKLKLDRRILESMVDNELLAQFAEANNLVVTDEQLVESINGLLGGKSVSNDDYRKIIASEFGLKVEDFESLHRRRMLAAMMEDAVIRDLPISDSDLKTNYYVRNDKVSVSYIRIDPAHFESKDKSAQMTEAQKYAGEIIKELNSGKKLDQITRTDLIKKDGGAAPNDKDVAPVFAQTDLFARAGSGFAPPFVDAAFSLSEANSFSREAIVADGKLYIVALKQRQHPKESDFAKDKDSFRQTLSAERAREFRSGFIDNLKKGATREINEALFEVRGREEMPVEG